jgi:hypothetical protein
MCESSGRSLEVLNLSPLWKFVPYDWTPLMPEIFPLFYVRLGLCCWSLSAEKNCVLLYGSFITIPSHDALIGSIKPCRFDFAPPRKKRYVSIIGICACGMESQPLGPPFNPRPFVGYLIWLVCKTRLSNIGCLPCWHSYPSWFRCAGYF